jgi:hypothetical protein
LHDNSPKSKLVTLKRDLELGRSLFATGQHLGALRHFAGVLQKNQDQPEAYDAASQALFAVLNADTVLDRWDDAERDLFYSTLILQEHCHKTPILHYRIVSQHTSGVLGFIEHIAGALSPAIRRLLQRNTINKNLVLIVILLREYLGDWLTQESVSRLHLEWFDKFTVSDLEIPYNCMFDSVTFRRNRADIISYLSNLHYETEDVGLSLYHVVFFEWLAQLNPMVSAGDDWLKRLLTARLERSSLPPVEVAAARSLIVRYWSSDHSESDFEALGFERDFVELASESAKIRSGLQHRSSFGRARLGMRLFDNRAWQGLQAARSLIGNHLPFVTSYKRKLKVAVCISGQLRGYASAFQSWKHTLLKDVDYDLFVHSWMRVGRSGAEPFRYVLPFDGERFTEKYREICLRIGLDEFKACYPTLFQALADTARVTEDEVAEFYGTPHVRLDDDDQPPFVALSNQEKMHSKIQSCFDMAMASGNEYDLIIRLRPDKPIKYLAYDWADIRGLCQATPTLFADLAGSVHFANPMIGDQFAAGALEPMRTYSTAWTWYPRFAANGLLKCPKSFEGHVSLAQVCWLHGISVRRVPIRFDGLKEPERLPSETIRHCLVKDAMGRMNGTDRLLLESISSDLKS